MAEAPREQGTGQRREEATSAPKVMGAAAEPIEFTQQNLWAVARVMARLGDLMPPQVDEDEMVAHLVLRLAEGTYDPTARRNPAGWLWQEALEYLRSHPVVKAAARWLHARTDAGWMTAEQLREVALALTVFGEKWLPGGSGRDEELLARAMTRLATEERLALAMYYFEGLTLPEIAEVLDMAPDEVSTLYANAMRHLRENVALVAMEMEDADGIGAARAA